MGVNREYLVPVELLIYHAKCADRPLFRYRVFVCRENPSALHPSVHPSLLPWGNKLTIKNQVEMGKWLDPSKQS